MFHGINSNAVGQLWQPRPPSRRQQRLPLVPNTGDRDIPPPLHNVRGVRKIFVETLNNASKPHKVSQRPLNSVRLRWCAILCYHMSPQGFFAPSTLCRGGVLASSLPVAHSCLTIPTRLHLPSFWPLRAWGPKNVTTLLQRDHTTAGDRSIYWTYSYGTDKNPYTFPSFYLNMWSPIYYGPP